VSATAAVEKHKSLTYVQDSLSARLLQQLRHCPLELHKNQARQKQKQTKTKTDIIETKQKHNRGSRA
jgi:hypothetical protein